MNLVQPVNQGRHPVRPEFVAQNPQNLLCLPWYVIHTKPRQEQLAAENLLRQSYRVYFPKIKQVKRNRGRLHAQLEPLFPRYIFLQPDSATHSISPVRSTFGVSTLVRFGHEPAVIRAETMRAICEFEARRNAARDEDISPFQPGVRVHIVDGPLAGMEGLISSVSHERIVVLMQLLGQDTRVGMSHHHVVLVQN
jgi:transcriptional antiterminator RfaH